MYSLQFSCLIIRGTGCCLSSAHTQSVEERRVGGMEGLLAKIQSYYDFPQSLVAYRFSSWFLCFVNYIFCIIQWVKNVWLCGRRGYAIDATTTLQPPSFHMPRQGEEEVEEKIGLGNVFTQN